MLYKVYNDLRFDYPNTGFGTGKGFVALEFDNNLEGKITRPYQVDNNFGLPQTRTGMLGSRDKIIPEFYLKEPYELPEGAVLRVYKADGTLEKTLILNDKKIWVEEI